MRQSVAELAANLGLILWGYGDSWSISLQTSRLGYIDYLRDATLAECRAFLVGYAQGHDNATCNAEPLSGERAYRTTG